MQKVLIESLFSILELTGLTEQKGKQQFLKDGPILPFLLFCLTVFAESWMELPAPLMPRGNLKSWTCPSVLSTATSSTGRGKGIWRRNKRAFLKLQKANDNCTKTSFFLSTYHIVRFKQNMN